MQDQESSKSSISKLLSQIREAYGLKKEAISGTEFSDFLLEKNHERKDCLECFVGFHYGKFLTKVHQMACQDKDFQRKLRLSLLGQSRIQ